MGSYRMAGGGPGMRQGIAQWAFKWPWSRLTEKPDLNDAFLDRVAEQADALLNVDPLDVSVEEKRDDLLVALLQALRSEGYGPGQTLARWEQGSALARLWPFRILARCGRCERSGPVG